jgi:tetratricopeptide (TPR) repeat protein
MTATNLSNESDVGPKSSTCDDDEAVKSNEESMERVIQPASIAERLVDINDGDDDVEDPYPSMTFALFVYWIIPLLFIAVFSRKVVDTSVPKINMMDRPEFPKHKAPSSRPTISPKTKQQQRPSAEKKASRKQAEFPTQWPTAYRKELNVIRYRRRPIDGFDGGIYSLLTKVANTTHAKSMSTRKDTVTIDASGDIHKSPSYVASTTANAPTKSGPGGSGDPTRDRFRQQIQLLQSRFQQNPNDIYLAITLADTMRMYDIQFHEGGTYEQDAIKLFHQIIELATTRRNEMLSAGQATDVCPTPGIQSISDEVTLDYPSKSIDGLLCGIYTSLGKLYFMANMFERAVEAYDKCLRGTIQQPYYLDALNSRASSLIVLGKYEEAGRDYLTVIQHDTHRLFVDAFTGMERILEAKEDSVQGGWDTVLSTVEDMIPNFEFQLKVEAQAKRGIADALNRLHHFLFTYHDKKTKNYDLAFKHLTEGFQHKLSVLPKWVEGSEKMKIEQTRLIFQRGFWSTETGSRTRTPIFIIGFVRSGSTLLERILDAHPMVAGTGENSVFNGRLGNIRDQIVNMINTGGSITDLTRQLADEVVDAMQKRYALIEANAEHALDKNTKEKPKRLVDKMLTNYYNVGFIEMLYPNALILHVAREPMDSVFSAYKHEFPPGTLDYTSDFTGLAELYHTYRDMMEHWDEVLPGRITHIRYEDMVKDFEGTARAIIKAANLPWDDGVLQFHKKKHAVNTLSSTQVRKGVYTDSLKSWVRYEKQLQPLIKLLGDRMEFDFETTLPGYSPASS